MIKLQVFLASLWQALIGVIIILALVIVASRVYFQSGFPYTHDGENHLARFANYKVALREGQWPPRWAPNLMNHYGYPVFNYNYPLANLLSLPFSIVGLNYELTFKIIAISGIFLGLWGLWRWLKMLKVKLGGRVFAASLFALAPFMTNLTFFRGNIGELLAACLFPWLLALTEKADQARKSDQPSLGLMAVVWVAAFFLSHNVTVMFGLPLWLAYSLLRHGFKKKLWLELGRVMGWAGVMSLWFWLPAVAEKNLVTVGQVGLVASFVDHFPHFEQLLGEPLSFGFSYLGPVDSLSFALGLGLIGSLLLGLVYAVRNWLPLGHKKLKLNLPQIWSKLKKPTTTFGLITSLLIIFQLPLSKIIWQNVPLVGFIQFPWRLSLFLMTFGAGLGALVWQAASKKAKWLLVILVMIQLVSQMRVKPADRFHKTNRDYDAFSMTTTTQRENLTPAFTYREIGDWQPRPKIIEGKGEINVGHWTGSNRSYQLQLSETSLVVEPTMNFAGWETVVQDSQGQKQLTQYLDDQDLIQGRIAYQLPAGNYQVESRFTQKTWPRLVGNTLSFLAMMAWLMIWGRKFFGKKLSFYLNSKLLLAVLAISAGLVAFYQPSFPYAQQLAESQLPRWLYSWANFDGVHYLTIAKKGYIGTGLIQAFFPLWPKLLSLAPSINLTVISFGLILNLILGWWLFKKWFKLVKLDLDEKSVWWSGLVLFLFPTAFFFQGLYSETLFLWLVISSFYAARQRRWWRAGIWAALASATRVVGIALLPALLVELVDQVGWQKFKSHLRQYLLPLLSISLSLLGLGSYMLFLWREFNDPLYFFHVQSEFGVGRTEGIILYPQVIWRYLKILWLNRAWQWQYLITVQEFMAGLVGLMLTVMSWFKVRKSYVVFSFLALIIPTLTGTFTSLPRYLLACPASFILMGQFFKKHQWLGYLWLAISLGLLAINTMLFIQGQWVA